MFRLFALFYLFPAATAMQLPHPALQEFQSRRLDDQSKNGFGCVTSNDKNRIQCKLSFGNGEYDVDETCQVAGLDQDFLICSVCAVNNGVMLPDGSLIQFCYDFQCSIEAMEKDTDRNFAKACECIEANVNGEPCSVCEFCPSSAKRYPNHFEDQVALLTPPLALVCPHSDVVNSDCPVLTDDGMSGGGKFGVTLVVFSFVGVAAYLFIRRRRTRARAARAAEGGNTSIWGGPSSS